MNSLNVSLLAQSDDLQTVIAAAALGCFEEKSSLEIYNELKSMPEEQRLEKEKKVIKGSYGRGHGAVGDPAHFIFSIENLTRAATLFLCSPEYLEHLQQSLRRASADRGYHLPYSIEMSKLADDAKSIMSWAFDFYDRACQGGIPAEDARFPLPLYTKTNITTSGNSRELCHLFSMASRPGVPSDVRRIVEEMRTRVYAQAPYLFEDTGFNYEALGWFPALQLFGSHNQVLESLVKKVIRKNCTRKHPLALVGYSTPFDLEEADLSRAVRDRDETYLANLKHIHFEFVAPMSLACFHQAMRQRTWNHSVESIYTAVEVALSYPKDRIVIPPSIVRSNMVAEYVRLHSTMIDLYKELTVSEKVPVSDAIGVVPHSLKIWDWIHINGWNAVHSIGKRTCPEAQWEIRGIARGMAGHIKKAIPVFKNYAEPQCVNYGDCPEIKNCGYLEKRKKK